MSIFFGCPNDGVQDGINQCVYWMLVLLWSPAEIQWDVKTSIDGVFEHQFSIYRDMTHSQCYIVHLNGNVYDEVMLRYFGTYTVECKTNGRVQYSLWTWEILDHSHSRLLEKQTTHRYDTITNEKMDRKYAKLPDRGIHLIYNSDWSITSLLLTCG